MLNMNKSIVALCLLASSSLVLADKEESPPAASGGAQNISAEQIKKGAAQYAQTCAACHGPRMADPEGAFDLRTFPHDQKSRFINSVTNGKGSMPPWGGLLKPDDIEALWAYVVAGEKK
jgi:mono/diheme cytochrome c family protein